MGYLMSLLILGLATYFGGAALGFGTATYKNMTAFGALAQAGMEAARGLVAAI